MCDRNRISSNLCLMCALCERKPNNQTHEDENREVAHGTIPHEVICFVIKVWEFVY